MERAGDGDRGSCTGLFAPVLSPDFLALEDSNQSIPPDTMGAVGPTHLVVTLNDRVRIQDRNGVEISTVENEVFWSSLLPDRPFDPSVVYDQLMDRFVVVALDDRRSPDSRTLMAVSRTSDPTGAWDFYEFDGDAQDTLWADFPRLGYNSTWLAFTNNMFLIVPPGDPEPFDSVSLWIIDKASLTPPGGPLTVTVREDGFDFVGGAFSATMVPATTNDPGESTLWLVDTAGFSSGGVQLHRLSMITGTGSMPEWDPAPGSPFTGTGLFFVANDHSPLTVDAPQLGTTARIEANDGRILDVEQRNGTLWYTHMGGMPDGAPVRTSAFWNEINPSVGLGSPFVQAGIIDAEDEFFLFPSIAVNCADDMMIGFSRATAGIYVEAAYTYRLAIDAFGVTRPVTTLRAGDDEYLKDFNTGRIRWGDYSATVVDPVDDTCMWTIQEYAAQDVGPQSDDDRWSTWWGRLCAGDDPPGPFSLTSPMEGETGVSSGPLVVWTTSANAGSYRVEIDDEPNFASSVVDVTQPAASGTQYQVPDMTLDGGELYYCRVTAINPSAQVVASPGVVSFETAGAPAPFLLVTPDEGDIDVPTGPFIDWGSSERADRYRVQIDLDGTFTSPVFEEVVLVGFGTNLDVPNGTLATSTLHFCRVIAENDIGTIVASPGPVSFTTAACKADIDGDGDTDIFDFAILADVFGLSLDDPQYDPSADLNGDDTVNTFDFAELADDFGCGL
jgi:hypothetical protein